MTSVETNNSSSPAKFQRKFSEILDHRLQRSGLLDLAIFSSR